MKFIFWLALFSALAALIIGFDFTAFSSTKSTTTPHLQAENSLTVALVTEQEGAAQTTATPPTQLPFTLPNQLNQEANREINHSEKPTGMTSDDQQVIHQTQIDSTLAQSVLIEETKTNDTAPDLTTQEQAQQVSQATKVDAGYNPNFNIGFAKEETVTPSDSLTGGFMPPSGDNANQAPKINHAFAQQLQAEINGWQLIQHQLFQSNLSQHHASLTQLFSDADNDPLTLQIALYHANGLSSLSQSELFIQGIPQQAEIQSYLIISAKDQQSDWVQVQLILPPVQAPSNTESHPLEGDAVYRLAVGTQLAGKSYPHEIVYCEGFQFIEGKVLYAIAQDRLTCPQAKAFKEVGHYQISDDTLLVEVNQQQQTWTTKLIYPSKVHPNTDNYFTTVFDGQGYESYTLQKNPQAQEKRLTGKTYVIDEVSQCRISQHEFDFLLPDPANEGDYLQGYASSYLDDYQNFAEEAGNSTVDTDFKIWVRDMDLFCYEHDYLWLSSKMYGKSENGYIVSSNSNQTPEGNYIDCFEYYVEGNTPDPNPSCQPEMQGFQAMYSDLEYRKEDIFIEGEIYSHIVKPHPKYAHLVEGFKINLIYTLPPKD